MQCSRHGRTALATTLALVVADFARASARTRLGIGRRCLDAAVGNGAPADRRTHGSRTWLGSPQPRGRPTRRPCATSASERCSRAIPARSGDPHRHRPGARAVATDADARRARRRRRVRLGRGRTRARGRRACDVRAARVCHARPQSMDGSATPERDGEDPGAARPDPTPPCDHGSAGEERARFDAIAALFAPALEALSREEGRIGFSTRTWPT